MKIRIEQIKKDFTAEYEAIFEEMKGTLIGDASDLNELERAHAIDKLRHELALCVYLCSYMSSNNLSTQRFFNSIPDNIYLRNFS